MAPSKRHRSKGTPDRPAEPPAEAESSTEAERSAEAELDLFEEMQRVLDAPLAEFMATEEERAQVEELTRLATASPVMGRLREVVAFVGPGRAATQAGNLKAADLTTLSGRLGTGERVPPQVRSVDDLPDTAHAFRWAAAAGFVEWRGTKIVAGPLASELDRDPFVAWLKAAITLLEHGLLDGFRRGWRKNYVELLDQNVAGLLVGMAEAPGPVPLTVFEDSAWDLVSSAHGYRPEDQAERDHVVRLVHAMIAQLVDLAVVEHDADQVQLTGLGGILATIAAFSSEDDEGDLDLVDTDAESLLLCCLEAQPDDARADLLAWTQARPAEDAAKELCEAMLDDDNPDLWRLGLEALSMLDPGVARPAARRLQAQPGLGRLATEWLRQGSSTRRPRRP